ncbi:divergent polysaccharide deacetylase family protein [Aliiroseovarius sp. 2305UL8-7]|uniref:divergent polysaccharide deacetylase family protein n=1 Tax=Aliiroseovarius conchicola TaxID=3121637 RepID=UPI0035271BD8
MARGFLSGVLWGSVVSVVGLGVVSLQIAPVKPSWETRAAPAENAAEEAPSDDAAPNDDQTAGQADSGTDTAGQAAASETSDATPDTAPQADQTPPDAISAPDAPDAVPSVDAEADAAVATPQAPEAPAQSEGAAPVEPDTPPAAAPSEATDNNSDGSASAAEEPEASVPQTIPDLANSPQIKSDPVAPIGDLADGVKTNRLPTIDDNVTEEAGAADADAPVLVTDGQSLAIDRNAAPFENPEGRPLMSIVLADQGPARASLGDLRGLPFPISVIVDASASDAEEAMAFYRDVGAEVIIKPTLPTGATPKDAEENFQAQAALTDQAVAVFMDQESGFQGDSALAAQISEILVASGHGLVSEAQGLNTGHKTALKTGVASGVVFRELDGDGQDGKVIRRFLDNAAFKAGQENGVILVGQAKSDTLQALIEWSLGNRVKSVAMAPVSALLLGG